MIAQTFDVLYVHVALPFVLNQVTVQIMPPVKIGPVPSIPYSELELEGDYYYN
jgi:hypothetical protein